MEIKYVIGTKERMTQIFNEDGVVTPATILMVTPMTVTGVRTEDRDGYTAYQIATRDQKESRVAKAQHTMTGGTKKFIREFRPAEDEKEALGDVALGATFDASAFVPGDTIAVSAVSKGKGFQGVMKRHGFHGDKATHGRKRTHRAPGSIGSTNLGRVQKGKRMAGRMGGDRVTVKNLRVLEVNADTGMLVVSGAVPGRKGTLVEVRSI